MAGWIKISREINTHWIWSDPVKLKWWIDILITVNFEDKKVPIGFKIFECKRGESLMSLVNWADRWKVSKSVVNNYFKMLESDGMIIIKNETVTTRITVCNYESYQTIENANKTERKRNTNATKTQHDTTKEREEGEERKEEYPLQIKDINIPKTDFEKLQAWMSQYTPTVCKLKTQMTEENLISLKKTYSSTLIAEKLSEMENKADLLKKYTSVYLTLRNWLKPKNT